MWTIKKHNVLLNNQTFSWQRIYTLVPITKILTYLRLSNLVDDTKVLSIGNLGFQLHYTLQDINQYQYIYIYKQKPRTGSSRNFFRVVCGFFILHIKKQHTDPSKGTRILGLVLYTLRDWAWFTAAKLDRFRTKWYTKRGSYNTYILTYNKHIHIEHQGTVKNEITRKKVKKTLGILRIIWSVSIFP